jgi:Rieske Fe-S protein
MERKEFIKACGFACLGGSFIAGVFEGCASSKTISGTISNSNLVVPAAAFQNKNSFYKYVVVRQDELKYPICLYRFSTNDYAALYMRCTHQGAELQVFGDKLECPAHGSAFNDHGVVQNGPADTNLRSFPVTVQNDQVLISLK